MEIKHKKPDFFGFYWCSLDKNQKISISFQKN